MFLLFYSIICVDNRSEKIVQNALNNARKGRTTIIIAHRLTTIRDADLILVFSDGNVVEQGTHEELMKLDQGIYRELATQSNLEVEEEEEEVVETNRERKLSNTTSSL